MSAGCITLRAGLWFSDCRTGGSANDSHASNSGQKRPSATPSVINAAVFPSFAAALATVPPSSRCSEAGKPCGHSIPADPSSPEQKKSPPRLTDHGRPGPHRGRTHDRACHTRDQEPGREMQSMDPTAVTTAASVGVGEIGDQNAGSRK